MTIRLTETQKAVLLSMAGGTELRYHIFSQPFTVKLWRDGMPRTAVNLKTFDKLRELQLVEMSHQEKYAKVYVLTEAGKAAAR